MKSIPLMYRIAIVVGVVGFCALLIFLDLSDLKNPRIKSQTNVNLGLDLRGGSFLVMQVQTGEAIREEAVGSSRVDLQACKLEYSIVSPK